MHSTFLPHLLALAEDTDLTTPALRVSAGLLDLVLEREAKAHGVAYIGEDQVYLCTGVTAKAIKDKDIKAVGWLKPVRAGTAGHLTDEKAHAGAWTSVKPPEAEIAVEGLEDPRMLKAMTTFFDPGHRNWSKPKPPDPPKAGSSGWRLALVLFSRFGFREADFSATEVGEWLGVKRQSAAEALERLSHLTVVMKKDRRWYWMPESIRLDIEWGNDWLTRADFGFRHKRENRTRDWKTARADFDPVEQWVKDGHARSVKRMQEYLKTQKEKS